jgi:predicted nucleic acid-binding protein
MTEASRGVLDTSVLIDHDQITADQLPDESAITAVTLAELAAGPHATDNKDERARRQDRLQWATATWDPLPFDAGFAEGELGGICTEISLDFFDYVRCTDRPEPHA